MKDDLIRRQAAVDALWKALYEYEDKTEKQFLESEELDVADWFQHRNFVQNMSDIDRQTLLDLPSAQPEAIPIAWLEEKAKWFSSLDNPFSKMEAVNISILIKDWLEEQEENG